MIFCGQIFGSSEETIRVKKADAAINSGKVQAALRIYKNSPIKIPLSESDATKIIFTILDSELLNNSVLFIEDITNHYHSQKFLDMLFIYFFKK